MVHMAAPLRNGNPAALKHLGVLRTFRLPRIQIQSAERVRASWGQGIAMRSCSMRDWGRVKPGVSNSCLCRLITDELLEICILPSQSA